MVQVETPATGPVQGARSTASMLRARTTVPAGPARAVHRPALDARLDEAAQHRLTVLSAGPGWGKTTAAALWAAARPPRSTAWLTLEAHDDTLAAFWRDVLEALRASGAVPEGHPLRRLHVPARVSDDFLRRAYRGVDELPRPVTLVLDEFHLIGDADVLGSVEDLLRYPLPLRLTLLTRSDPPLALHRLRVDGELTEVVAQDLAFDGPSAVALAAAEGVHLSREQADQAVRDTDGWPAGLRLHLRTARRGNGTAPARSAAEYLIAEVLEHEPPEVQQFLLLTSVTTSVCPELAAALAPGSRPRATLDALVAANDFVSPLGDGTWFRYHPLLREMLQGQLHLEDPDAFRQAHRRAARWLARHDEPQRALEHALAAEDWALVGEVFAEAAAPGLGTAERDAVADLLARVPYADLPPSAPLELCAAALAFATGRHEACHAHLERARALTRGTPDPVSGTLLHLIAAASARAVGDVDAAAVAGAAAEADLDRVPWPFPALDAYRTAAVGHHAAGTLWTGHPAESVPALTALLADAPAQPPSLALLDARSTLALAHAFDGALDDGERVGRRVIEDARAWGWTEHVQARPAHAAVAWSRLLRADVDEADRMLALGLAAEAGGPEPASAHLVLVLQALAAVSRGRARAAARALADAERVAGRIGAPAQTADLLARARLEVHLISPPGAVVRRPVAGGPPSRPVAQLCHARALLAAGRHHEALGLATAVAEQGERDDAVDLLTRVEAWIACAAARLHLSGPGPEQPLTRALELAGPRRLVRPFLSARPPGLDAPLAHALVGRPDALAATLRQRMAAGSPTEPPDGPVEALTERERAILAALPSMASNAEIGAEFFVSVNTVKAHLKALYRKLDVNTRRDAVRRGRELGLID
ncbi:LuxR C-terminal-related transcriptional regulator [Cellulomonas hominis]|jgi:LuxR family maltose regulon positive regulatory protein|uniref:LuxR C-terminal-related transcriptional regulator n=1 Tax=Cellulomonas hominis TaxID=156981 RepID=UPI001C124AA6|nr:LuxR C-terminal-related transcriptional regulator [Cellulomonas hominis]MBU5423193.1 LuxR C-terminal-related transcriptional regulator [Cellulomonas hominis]